MNCKPGTKYLRLFYCFRYFRIEDNSSSNFRVGELLRLSEFINHENPRFAICVLFAESKTFLCVLEIDLNGGILIVHQLHDLNIEGKYNLRLIEFTCSKKNRSTPWCSFVY